MHGGWVSPLWLDYETVHLVADERETFEAPGSGCVGGYEYDRRSGCVYVFQRNGVEKRNLGSSGLDGGLHLGLTFLR